MIRSLLLVFIFLFSLNSFGQCDNVTSGGIIGFDEVQCGAYDPNLISDVQSPAGGSGQLEFMWIKTFDPNNYTAADAIPGAHDITYDPPLITQTTWFVRCARRVGCTDWLGESIVKKEVSPMNASVDVVHIGCNGSNTGEINILVNGGAQPYSYLINGNPALSNNSYFPPGAYLVEVFDLHGCSWSDSVTIYSSNLNVTVNQVDDPCTSSGDYAELIVTGGQAPYSVVWSNGETGITLDGNGNGLNGIYTFWLTDAIGCQFTSSVYFQKGEDSFAELLCCQDTVICSGSEAHIQIELDGIGPWDIEWTENGSLSSAHVTQSPFTINTSPNQTTIYELVSVSTQCGEGTVCGKTTIAVNDCSGTSCQGCFYSSELSQTNYGECIKYEMYITANGCQHDLSNLTISIPCGDVTEMSNSYGFDMFLQSNDPNSGLTGIKIDNISGFDQWNPMLVTFTICPDECDNVMSCLPIVAYKAANCVYYEETIPYNDIFKMYSINTEVTAAPNPFDDHAVIKIKYGRFHPLFGHGEVKIVDLSGRTIKNFEVAQVSPTGTTIVWDGTDNRGVEVMDGFYILYYFVEGQQWAEEIKVLKFQR